MIIIIFSSNKSLASWNLTSSIASKLPHLIVDKASQTDVLPSAEAMPISANASLAPSPISLIPPSNPPAPVAELPVGLISADVVLSISGESPGLIAGIIGEAGLEKMPEPAGVDGLAGEDASEPAGVLAGLAGEDAPEPTGVDGLAGEDAPESAGVLAGLAGEDAPEPAGEPTGVDGLSAGLAALSFGFIASILSVISLTVLFV